MMDTVQLVTFLAVVAAAVEVNAVAIINKFREVVWEGDLETSQWTIAHIANALWAATGLHVMATTGQTIVDNAANRDAVGDMAARHFVSFKAVFFSVKNVVVEIADTVVNNPTINSLLTPRIRVRQAAVVAAITGKWTEMFHGTLPQASALLLVDTFRKRFKALVITGPVDLRDKTFKKELNKWTANDLWAMYQRAFRVYLMPGNLRSLAVILQESVRGVAAFEPHLTHAQQDSAYIGAVNIFQVKTHF